MTRACSHAPKPNNIASFFSPPSSTNPLSVCFSLFFLLPDFFNSIYPIPPPPLTLSSSVVATLHLPPCNSRPPKSGFLFRGGKTLYLWFCSLRFIREFDASLSDSPALLSFRNFFSLRFAASVFVLKTSISCRMRK